MIHSTTTRACWTALLSAALFNRKAAALLAAGLLPAQAATDIYSGQASGSTTTPTTGNFLLGFNGNGATGYATPTGSATENLTFNGTGATPYTATDNFAGLFSLNVLTLNSTASVSETIASSALTNTLSFAGSAPATGIVQNGSGAFTISSILTGTNGLTFSAVTGGTGSVTLSGNNAYTGGTTVNSGTLVAGVSTTAFGVSSNQLTINGGTVDFNGKGEQISGLSGAPGGTLNNSQAVTSTLNLFGGTGTFAGIISGNFNINEAGSANGIEIFSGANTYIGSTTVKQGTLTVGTGGTLGATTNTLVVSNSNKTAAGNAAFLNLSTTAPTTTGSLSGTIAATTGGGKNTVTINNGGQLFTVNQTAANTYAGVIAGTGGFTLGSSSTAALTLTGGNTFTGDININAGTLKAGSGYTGTSAATDLGNVTVARNINVNNGGTLTFGATNVLGDSSSSAPVATLTVAAGGLVNSVGGQFNMLGPVILTGGTITSTAGYGSIYDSFLFRGNVTTSGIATSTLSTSGGANSQ